MQLQEELVCAGVLPEYYPKELTQGKDYKDILEFLKS